LPQAFQIFSFLACPAMPHTVMLAMPGPTMTFATAKGIIEASSAGHTVGLDNSGGSWDNFNTLFALALNRAQQGLITHFAMLHSDVAPQAGWLDVLLEECDRLDADLISAVVPLKDARGVTSCGLGRLGEPFGGAYRRVTVRELADLPPSFDAYDLAESYGSYKYAGMPLLHNNGCWVCDLRKPVFYSEEPVIVEGQYCVALSAMFAFPRRVVKYKGEWCVQGESEDWYFSRRLWELDARTCLTQRVKLSHLDGGTSYPNHGHWGEEHDQQTRCWWDVIPSDGQTRNGSGSDCSPGTDLHEWDVIPSDGQTRNGSGSDCSPGTDLHETRPPARQRTPSARRDTSDTACSCLV
jgi:hypothetical protein